MEVAPARKAAYDVLRRVAEEGAYADRALRSASEGLDDRDRALARQLAFGSVQRQRTLDHAIETLGKRPVRKLDPPVLAALRLGAYQLGYLGGVPRYAAVNESVELVRRANLERAVPFTNAVLRRVSEGIALLLFELPEGPLKHSFPDWIWDVWRRDLGEDEALALMRAQNESPETIVRLVRGEIEGEPTDIPGAWRVDRVDEQALAEGRIWPQSRGSQLAGLVVGSQAGERVLDLCAAPGGKATMLAGDVTAVEVNEARARELEENVARLGATNVRVVHADGLALPPELTGIRPGPRRRAVLGPRSPRCAARPPLALGAAPRASARPPARRGRAHPGRRHDRLLGLHDQRRRVRSGGRRLRPHGRSDRGMAGVPPSVETGVPADVAARPRHERLLRRASARLADAPPN